jgi:hypothetical protein
MALLTAGTNAATSLLALNYSAALSQADLAAFSALLFDDRVNVYPNIPTAALNPIPTAAQGPLNYPLGPGGRLVIPNRGFLRVFPGDYVMVDAASGWPILVSRTAMGVGGTVWAHS